MARAFYKNSAKISFRGFIDKNIDIECSHEIIEKWQTFCSDVLLSPFTRNLFNNKINLAYLRAYYGVFRELRTGKYDFLFTRSIAIVFVLYLLRFDGKIILELHNNKLAGPKALDWCYKCMLKRRDNLSIIVISGALKKYFLNLGIKERKICAFHDGVDLDAVRRTRDRKLEIKKMFGNDKIVFTYAGSLYADRKISRIVKLAISYPDLNFLVIGGTEKEIAAILSSEGNPLLENLIFLGRIRGEEVQSWLLSSDVLLALWSWEVRTMKYCSPLKVFEYLLTQKIFICEAFPTILEVIDESNAILVEPENMQELTVGVKAAVDLVKSGVSMGNNYDLVRSRYTWVLRASEILSLSK